jgi:hypothetical protein
MTYANAVGKVAKYTWLSQNPWSKADQVTVPMGGNARTARPRAPAVVAKVVTVKAGKRLSTGAPQIVYAAQHAAAARNSRSPVKRLEPPSGIPAKNTAAPAIAATSPDIERAVSLRRPSRAVTATVITGAVTGTITLPSADGASEIARKKNVV